MHAEFSSQLINYAVLTLATVSFSLCKHEAAQNGKGVGRAGCQAPSRDAGAAVPVLDGVCANTKGGLPSSRLQRSGFFFPPIMNTLVI